MKIIKQVLLIFLSIGFMPFIHGQTIMSTNSSAVSSNTLIYSVGEIFVTPINQDNTNSGVIGALSRIEFFSLGIDEIVSLNKLKLYPNPVSKTVFLEAKNLDVKKIWIYNINGKLVSIREVSNSKVDLKNLQTGIYFIKINNLNIKSFKIIKN